MRFTKIVCTMGPSSNTREQMIALADKGMCVARMNFSHGNHETHAKVLAEIRAANEELKKRKEPSCIAILLDTKGPEVRTGDVTAPIVVKRGDQVIFSSTPMKDAKLPVIEVLHDKFSDDVRHAKTILVDNGESSFDVVSIEKNGSVVAKANDDASIGSRRHVNLPGVNLSMPSITTKDWDDIAFGVENNVDFVALSFVRTSQEIEEVRGFIKSKGARTQIIAKIETLLATENIESIVAASDGIMVARGDLGAEVPFERVPVLQDRIVNLCKASGKPVIVATHMLESMISKPMPTRAEVTDIAHAATTGTDATMLSGETASGKYPLGALDAMARVLEETEQHVFTTSKREEQPIADEREARAEAAVKLAASINAKAIVVITRSGMTALDVVKFRPRIPVLAFTPFETVQHQLNLSYGTKPFVIQYSDDPESTVATALNMAQSAGLLARGDRIVLVSDTKAHELIVNTVQVRFI